MKTALIIALLSLALLATARAATPVCSDNDVTIEGLLQQANPGMNFNAVDTAGLTCPVHHSTCSDTDGGIDEFTQGTVSGTIYVFGHGVDYQFTDFCMPCHENKLVEFYCKDGHCDDRLPALTTITCANGCVDGACTPDVPEFGIIAGCVAIAGAIAGFFVLRKK
jgi:hypothetical protein